MNYTGNIIIQNVITKEKLEEILSFIKKQKDVDSIDSITTADDRYKDVERYCYDYKATNTISISVNMYFDIEEFKSYDKSIDYSKLDDMDLFDIFDDEALDRFSDLECSVREEFNLDEIEYKHFLEQEDNHQ